MIKIFKDKTRLSLLKKTLDEVYKDTNIKYFIVGSQLIDNVESHDVDVLINYDYSMNITELRATRKHIWDFMNANREGIDADGYRFNLIFNFIEDNVKLKTDFLYYDITNKDEKKADKEKLSEEEYVALKLHLRTTLPQRKKYYKAIIPNHNSTPMIEHLNSLNKDGEVIK